MDDDGQVLDSKVDLMTVPRDRLAAMADAGRTVVECRAMLAAAGRTVIAEIAGDQRDPFTHYPRGDVYDFQSHGQYYFHSHRSGECGHFHTFLRPRGMPPGIWPDDPADRGLIAENEALSHLVAISVDETGEPVELFTTNRWVTAETWYRAADVCAMLPCFQMDRAHPPYLANRWITALLALFRPQIETLLAERDACIDRNRFRLSGIPVFEDRELEVTSRMRVSVGDHLAQVQRALDEAPPRP